MASKKKPIIQPLTFVNRTLGNRTDFLVDDYYIQSPPQILRFSILFPLLAFHFGQNQ